MFRVAVVGAGVAEGATEVAVGGAPTVATSAKYIRGHSISKKNVGQKIYADRYIFSKKTPDPWRKLVWHINSIRVGLVLQLDQHQMRRDGINAASIRR